MKKRHKTADETHGAPPLLHGRPSNPGAVACRFGFVALDGRVVPKDEEDKRAVLWECGRTVLCRPDDWIAL